MTYVLRWSRSRETLGHGAFEGRTGLSALGMSRMAVLGLTPATPPGDGGALRDDRSSCPFPDIVFADTYTYRGWAWVIKQPTPLAAHDRCGVRFIGRVGVAAC